MEIHAEKKLSSTGEGLTTGLGNIHIQHGDKKLLWSGSAYDRVSIDDPERIFLHINQYWATLPKKIQGDIFSVYQQIDECFESCFDPNHLHEELVKKVRALYGLIDLDDLWHWLNFHAEVRFPPNLKDNYGEDDVRERTYLRSDYSGLVFLAVALRPIVPVWGEYIRRIRSQAGSVYKEYAAMKLLSTTKLIRTEAVQRLRVYVEHSELDNANTMPAVLSGLGSTELPEWLLSLAVVRRLSICEVSSSDEKGSIISNIYNFLQTTVTSLDRKFYSRVTEKHRHMKEGDEEDKASRVESYKVKQEVPDGELVALNVYTEQMADMTRVIDPDTPIELMEMCYDRIKENETIEIREHHLTLSKWVTAKALSARGIPFLTKPALLRVMTVTQAILWHWQFYDLAALTTAQPIERDDMLLSEGRPLIPRDLVQRLSEIYPHYQQKGSRKRVRDRQANVGCIAVDELTTTMTGRDWHLGGPDELIQKTSAQGVRRTSVPGDLKAQLARLIITLAERE